MKDNFSGHAADYARFRPRYPVALYDFIRQLAHPKNTCWDCATGNGQVAVQVADFFNEVYATDISTNQLANAPKRSNITYSAQPAEKTNFPDDFFDLVIVGQAIHWFQFDAFYEEVKRVSRKGGHLVVIGYGINRINEAVDEVVNHFYYHIIGSSWDPERKYLDEKYTTIPFPLKEMESPVISMDYSWTLDHYLSYINTWSAVKHYIKKEGHNPVAQLGKDLQGLWPSELVVKFPLYIRTGVIS